VESPVHVACAARLTAPPAPVKTASGRRIRMPSPSFVASALYKHAEDHYTDGGWDVIVECWTLEMIDEQLTKYGICTFPDAVKFFGEGVVAVWADQQADAINSAF